MLLVDQRLDQFHDPMLACRRGADPLDAAEIALLHSDKSTAGVAVAADLTSVPGPRPGYFEIPSTLMISSASSVRPGRCWIGCPMAFSAWRIR